jgi:hypothetical protein
VRPRRLLLAAAAVLIVAAAGYLLLRGTPLGRAGELIADAGEKQLREPLRPARGAPRVLVFALDGVGEDELLRAARSRSLPHISAALGASGNDGLFERAWAVPGALSILPSTTVAAWVSTFTGEPPARSGVPGNEWFDRTTRHFYAPAPVTVEDFDHALAAYTDGLLGSVIRVPTLFERADVRSYVALSHVHRGADLLLIPGLDDVGDLVLAAAAGLADADERVEQDAFRELDQTAVERLVEAIGTHGVADLQVVYFPGIDLYTHVAEHALEDQHRYLRDVIDPAVGRILDAYARAGARDDTWIVFVSDHGHTPVLADDRNALETEGDDEPPAVLERVGFRVRPFELELDDDEQDFQAVLAYQGAMAYVYLADRAMCAEPRSTCDWTRPPRFNEDVLAVVRAFDAANRTGAHVPALRGTLDLILAREPRPPHEEALPFRVWDGTTLLDVEEYLDRHPRPDLLDLAARLDGLARGPYGHQAGDVLLITRSGIERPIDDRFYFSSLYRSWHGSPTAQDSRIPIIVAHPSLSGEAIRQRVRAVLSEQPSQLDITPLLLELLRR